MTASPRRRALPSTRAEILARSIALLRRGEAVSLDSVARAAGLTKAGLMHHFPTKEALMTALVDHQLDSYERALTERLPSGPHTAEQRIRAYVRWAFTADHDPADLVMLSDPKLREQLITRWTRRFTPWVQVPEHVAPEVRARLLAARLLADGHWFTEASATITLTAQERRQVLAVAEELLAAHP